LRSASLTGFWACWQEYIRDLEKEEEEEKRLQKVALLTKRTDE
jgi:hypothetical protein